MTNNQEPEFLSEDLTPEVGAATDVAPVSAKEKPAHELTATEDRDVVDWSRVTQLSVFRSMVKAKLRFIIPAVICFVIYYFSLPVLVGYAPEFMSRKIVGVINVAYLFALSQFFMAWIIAGLYLRAASRFDQMERRVIEEARAKMEGSN